MSQRDGSKLKENTNILYRVNVSDLKTKYRNKRIYNAIISLTLQILIFVLLSFFLGFYALIGLILGILFILPNPLPPAPTIYAVTISGIKTGNKERVIFNNKLLSFKIKEKEMYVSIIHRWKGEIIMLYSPEPKKLYDLLMSLKKDSELKKYTHVSEAENQRNKIEARVPDERHITMNIFIERLRLAILKNPPLILLIIASILAFFGLITGNLTISITAEMVFLCSIITWIIWYIYKRIVAK